LSSIDCGHTELRFEYRHDFSNVNPDFDSLSDHLTMAI
jgi:hypothetical protein